MDAQGCFPGASGIYANIRKMLQSSDSQLGVILPDGGYSTMLGHILHGHDGGGRASSGQKPEMLPNILRYSRQHPIMKNIQPKM